MSQCKKLIRCTETAEEHGSYCVNHKPAYEPKTRCDAILKKNRQCRNWARNHETKCSSHGPKVVRQDLVPQVYTTLGRPAFHIDILPQIEKSLKDYWKAQVDDSKQPIRGIAEWFEQNSDGEPYLVVVLPKEDDHDIEFGEKLPIGDMDRIWMDIDVQPQKA